MIILIRDVDADHWVSKVVLKSPRPFDIKEYQTIHKELTFEQAIRSSFTMSVETWAFLDSAGNPVGVGGVAENNSIWFIGTHYADTLRNRVDLLNLGHHLLRQSTKAYGKVWNLCTADRQQLRIMRKLGFTVSETARDEVRYIECAL